MHIMLLISFSKASEVTFIGTVDCGQLAGGLITANFTYVQHGFYTPQRGLLPLYIFTAFDIFTVPAVPAGPVTLVIVIKTIGVTCVTEIVRVTKAAGIT